MARVRFLIICNCGHVFTRATICQRNLRTWDCPQRHQNLGVRHDTHAADPVETLIWNFKGTREFDGMAAK
jgi:hypothetical protein